MKKKMDGIVFEKRIVYAGRDKLTLDLPEQLEKDTISGFEAIFSLSSLGVLRGPHDQASYLQAFCVHYYALEFWWGLTVLVPYNAVDWVLCFPVERRGRQFIPRTNVIPPDSILSNRDPVFFFFANPTETGTPVTPFPAVLDLNDLIYLSPHQGDNLALVRLKNWLCTKNLRWDKSRNVAFIQPHDASEIEIILDSEVRVF